MYLKKNLVLKKIVYETYIMCVFHELSLLKLQWNPNEPALRNIREPRVTAHSTHLGLVLACRKTHALTPAASLWENGGA